MRSKLIVDLVTYENKPNTYSDEGVKIPSFRTVYGNKYNLSSSEQLRAQQESLRVRGKVEIWSFEYNDEPDIAINGDIHTILAVDERGDKTIVTYGHRLAK